MKKLDTDSIYKKKVAGWVLVIPVDSVWEDIIFDMDTLLAIKKNYDNNQIFNLPICRSFMQDVIFGDMLNCAVTERGLECFVCFNFSVISVLILSGFDYLSAAIEQNSSNLLYLSVLQKSVFDGVLSLSECLLGEGNINKLLAQQIDIDPEIAKLINDNIFDLI